MSENTTTTEFTTELLVSIFNTLDIARDTNTLIVRENAAFRQYAKELIKQLQETTEYKIGYANRYQNADLPTTFVSKNIIAIWQALHSIGQGDNSLSMKVHADKLATAIKNSDLYLGYQEENFGG